MKTPFSALLLVGSALVAIPFQVTRADDSATANLSAPATTTPTGDKGARLEKLKADLAQLDLNDDQKAKIKDIFTTVPAGKERRQQIVALLTPEQKEKLKAMIKERRDADGGGATTTPVAN